MEATFFSALTVRRFLEPPFGLVGLLSVAATLTDSRTIVVGLPDRAIVREGAGIVVTLAFDLGPVADDSGFLDMP